jgi:hypothetical protein
MSIKFFFTAGLSLLVGLSVAAPARASNKPLTEEAPRAGAPLAPPPPARTALTELGAFIVPIGGAYLRTGLGVTLRYQVPLVNKPGVLWETTNVTVGVRETYGYVNNTLGAFVEVTPIAFFKLQAVASYDTLLPYPFAGGMRRLTPLGKQKLAAGEVERGNSEAIDWVDGKENRAIFEAPLTSHGLRLRIQPTLQAKLGPILLQYNFAIDYNNYRAGSYGGEDEIYHDTFTFSLRRMRDWGMFHEGTVAYQLPVKADLRVGVTSRFYRPMGTKLDSLSVNGLVYFRPSQRFLRDRLSPYAAVQLGTLLLDPMHRYDFSWLILIAADFKLFG